MASTVSVANFEGPLALLLDLVQRNELEVTSVSVGAVTQQYLQRVSEIESPSRQDLAQFLELGARLLYIKSLALLPGEDEAAPQEELQRLNQELAEYRQFKQATAHLQQRLKSGHKNFARPAVAALSADQLPMPEISLLQLGAIFSQALQRARPTTEAVIQRQHYDQAEIADRLMVRLEGSEISLNNVIEECRDRAEIIVTFLAVLELFRDGQITVRQSRLFDDINLVRTS